MFVNCNSKTTTTTVMAPIVMNASNGIAENGKFPSTQSKFIENFENFIMTYHKEIVDAETGNPENFFMNFYEFSRIFKSQKPPGSQKFKKFS